MDNVKPGVSTRKDSNKVYFLILVIIALLGTNAYLFFKEKKTNDKVVTLSDEKSQMSVEIDKIEAELDKVSAEKVVLTEELKAQQVSAQLKIKELRIKLRAGELTQQQLQQAQKEVRALRVFVSQYSKDLQDLKDKNASLLAQRDSLKSTLADANMHSSQLERRNSELKSRVKEASALKATSIKIVACRVKSSGKHVAVTRASTASLFKITFNIATNNLARKTMHDIFIRVIDPTGNLIIADNGTIFTANGDDLQYTHRSTLNFDNSPEKEFNIDWNNSSPFQKGEYTVLLYSDGFTMGQGKITLR